MQRKDRHAAAAGDTAAAAAHLDLVLGQPRPVGALLLLLDVEEELAGIDAALGLLRQTRTGQVREWI